MLSIFNEQYFIDIDKVDVYVQIESKKKERSIDKKNVGESNVNEPNANTISIVKYDLLKLMIEIVMDGHDNIDEKMGIKSTELTIPFKLAFNTLLNKKIITKY